ncbi:tenascin C [Tieghemostelium lacteum]|uniref:Tenascin C n=1 Tax=Tieghemostelium lacteum TaxID=361077 RepID=A0A152A2W9_TIELA|nr:tenascin C [Tieghemostelium lacteum]|eukprot:KYR00603.1 tenascin C [Tieghemostelium lacteum]
MKISYVIIILTVYLLFNEKINCTDIHPTDYDQLVLIRSVFHLETIFPVAPYQFCNSTNNNNIYFRCQISAPYYYLYSIYIEGSGSEILPNLGVFSRLREINIKGVGNGNDIVTNLQINNSILICQQCNITQLPEFNTTMKLYSVISPLNALWLIDNPLSTNISLNQIKTKNMSLLNSDNGAYSNYTLQVTNDLTKRLDIVFLNFMVNNDSYNFTNINRGALSINLMKNTPVSYNISKLLLTIRGVSRTNIYSNELTTEELQFPEYLSQSTFSVPLFFSNINFKTPISPISIGSMTVLSIINSPNFNINGASPIQHNNSQSLSFLQLSGTGLTVPLQILPTLDYLILSNNNITQLPTLINETSSIFRLDLSNNNIQDTISNDFCKIDIIISNNQFTSDLPDCFLCYINHQSVSDKFKGNQFSNWNENDSTYPPCNSIEILSSWHTNISLQQMLPNFNIEGVNLPRSTDQISTTPGIDPTYFELSSYYSNISIRTGNTALQQIQSQGYLNVTFLATTPYTLSIPYQMNKDIQVYNISSVPRAGGYDFAFFGLNLGGQSTTTVRFGNEFNCQVYDLNIALQLNCIISSISIPEKEYLVNITVANVNSVIIPYRFVRMFPIISSIVPSGRAGGLATINGFFGASVSNVTVAIGDQNCQVQSFTSIGISFIAPPGQGSNTLYLKVDSLPYKYYYVYKEDNIQCTKDCGPNGVCDTLGSCTCFGLYSGPTCTYLVSNNSVIINENSTIISSDNTNFEISLRSIQEISYDGSLKREIHLHETGFKLISRPDENTWNFGLKLFNLTTISYTVYKVPQDMNITFAGVEMALKKDGIKISVNISKWEFQSSLHTLQLTMGTNIQSESECTTNINSSQDTLDNIDYFTIEQEGKVLYGKFIDQMMSDGKPTYSSTKVLSKTDNEVIVGISIPHCTNECVIDPNMSVLVDPSNGCSGSSRSKWLIPTVVVVTVVGGLAIILSAAYMYRKRYQYKLRILKERVMGSIR